MGRAVLWSYQIPSQIPAPCTMAIGKKMAPAMRKPQRSSVKHVYRCVNHAAMHAKKMSAPTAALPRWRDFFAIEEEKGKEMLRRSIEFAVDGRDKRERLAKFQTTCQDRSLTACLLFPAGFYPPPLNGGGGSCCKMDDNKEMYRSAG